MKHKIKATFIATLLFYVTTNLAIPCMHVRGSDPAVAESMHKKMTSIVAHEYRGDTVQKSGPFGGFFDLTKTQYKDSILVSSTDGVGMKCTLAQTISRHDTVGFDLVANCVNSLVAQGAEPLFFLDYFATGKLNINEGSQLLTGIAAACKASNCSLIGAETTEMPGVYQQGAYDIAGFAVGIVERHGVLPHCEQIEVNDVLIGLAGTGIHVTGFSRLAKVIQEKNIDLLDKPPFMSYHRRLADALLEPSTLYAASILPLCKANIIKAIAHTPDGLIDGLEAVIPQDLNATINTDSWHIPPVFRWIKHISNYTDAVMAQTYNLGIGMVIICTPDNAPVVIEAAQKHGIIASEIGKIHRTPGACHITCEGAIQPHSMKIMILGTGGSEHALAWKCAQSPCAGIVCVAPGNGGTCHEPKIKNIPMNLSHTNALLTYAQQNKIDLIIPGDSCLGTDFVSLCAKKSIRCLGPSKSATALAKSATQLQEFCTRHAIPYLAESSVATERVTERLVVAAVSDGTTILPFSSAILYPHKLNGGQGEITDGMGAYSPAPSLTPALEQCIMKEIFNPLLHGMQIEDMQVSGFMHATIIIKDDRPHLSSLQFGLGDPQAETILMRLKTDLCLLCNAAYDGELNCITLEWDSQTTLSTIITSNAYPASSKGGDVIAGATPDETLKSAKIFHLGTSVSNGKLVTTSQGRILCATGLGKTRDAAREEAYKVARNIYWPDLHYRTDIGYKNK